MTIEVIRSRTFSAAITVGLALLCLASCGSRIERAVDELDGVQHGRDAGIALETLASPGFAPFPLVQIAMPSGEKLLPKQIWRHKLIPGKQATRYTYERTEGRHSIKASAVSSASMLRQSVRVDADRLAKLNFSWKVPQLIAGADLTQRETHDSPVRVVLVFEGDRSKFSTKNAMLSELALALTGEELPYATLMYVWCNACTAGTAIVSPRTDRIREIIAEAGPARLDQWLEYQRDIRADFEAAFGEPPGALLDIGIMTDTDNTRQDTVAWYGPLSLSE